VCLGPDTARFLPDNITETVRNANLRLALSHQNVPLNPILTAGLDATPINRVEDLPAAHAGSAGAAAFVRDAGR